MAFTSSLDEMKHVVWIHSQVHRTWTN